MRDRFRIASFVTFGSLLAIAACGSKAFAIDAARPASHNLSVDNHNRNDVIAFWYGTYLSSEELFSHFKIIVANNTDALPRFGEIRNVGDMGGDFIFLKKQTPKKVP